MKVEIVSILFLSSGFLFLTWFILLEVAKTRALERELQTARENHSKWVADAIEAQANKIKELEEKIKQYES